MKKTDVLLDMPRSLFSYDCVRQRLFVRMFSPENVPGGDPVVRMVENIAAVPYIFLEGNVLEGGKTASVGKKLAEIWGVSEEEVFAEAIRNGERLFPAKIMPIGQVMQELTKAEILEPDGPMVYVISNRAMLFGASAIMYPEVREWLAGVGGGYLLPSSVHEWIAVPDSGVLDPNVMKELVITVNQTKVAPKDRLSDSVYRFDENGLTLTA